MKKIAQAAAITAALAFSAGSALAQGTTGVVTDTSAGAKTTATHIAPADGSSALQQPGGMATQGASMPVYQSHLSGATMLQASQSTKVDGNRTITTTSYWVDVPANAQADNRFQRWQRLR